jgi:GNAT superfamily N-acetyltransferase
MIEIRRNTPSLAVLTDYASIPISFYGRSQLTVHKENGQWTFTEKPLASFFKDYDTLEHPTQWAIRFDVSRWMMFYAFENGRRVGGAIVAVNTDGIDMLEGRSDLAVLWDIRVHSDLRSHGVGSQLFREVADWSREQGCKEIKIETQQMNVSACKFYKKMGCELRFVHEGHYPELPEEIQLLWYREL